MFASSALQTSLKQVFFERTHINVSPFSVKAWIAWLFLQKWTISLILFGNTLQKSCFNQIKITTAISFWANYCLLNVRVTAATLECNTPAQNVFTVIIMTVWQNRQTWHYFITAICNANCMLYTFNMAGIHNIGFLDTQLKE